MIAMRGGRWEAGRTRSPLRDRACTRNMITPRQSATDDSSTDDDGASQTTEDDPQIPESQHAPLPPAQLHPPPVAPPPGPSNPPPPTNTHTRARPRYELRHTLRGHTMSISSVKFSPDGTLLASCGALGSLYQASLFTRPFTSCR
jgi:WD40 repeat protein